jgi:hypothetical protein
MACLPRGDFSVLRARFKDVTTSGGRWMQASWKRDATVAVMVRHWILRIILVDRW